MNINDEKKTSKEIINGPINDKSIESLRKWAKFFKVFWIIFLIASIIIVLFLLLCLFELGIRFSNDNEKTITIVVSIVSVLLFVGFFVPYKIIAKKIILKTHSSINQSNINH